MSAQGISGIPSLIRQKKAVSFSRPHPYEWSCQKIRKIGERFFGYLLRVAVFQMGEQNHFLKRAFMKIYQLTISCDPKEIQGVDRQRLERSKDLLYLFGAKETTVLPEDGDASIRLMTATSADFFQRIDHLGGKIEQKTYDSEERRVIVPKDGISPNRFDALCNDLKKFHLKIVEIDGQKAILLPPRIKAETAPMVIRFHSPGRSMAMDRTWIGPHLAAGCDICVSDPRGTVDSTGIPSEGGYYLDAAAVLEYVQQLGYAPEKTYVSGYCEGAAQATYLKAKNPQIHLIVENTFDSLKGLFESHPYLGPLATLGLRALQSTNPEIVQKVEQDGFDNAKKLREAPPSTGKVVLIYTSTDKIVPKDTHEKIKEAVNGKFGYFEYKREPFDLKQDGHTPPPTQSQDEVLWRWYAEQIG